MANLAYTVATAKLLSPRALASAHLSPHLDKAGYAPSSPRKAGAASPLGGAGASVFDFDIGPGRARRLSALGVFPSKSVLYGAFV